ncbi:hypothetical protein IP81_14765 [Novosphingobium sp. AAP83]|uniref:hypothetical protein n=1 Tax=Novosphingobium sp. AAP83 TaxID=1523425 RepID=UPI0006BA0975|nr:hypothetical protein [Novosphingobium sp. AAP83]KPF90612.1 hypothetical protein IP81_14765 [Novosphingobium sp. AAP83]
MNTAENILPPQPPTVDQLNGLIVAAQTEYANYKSSAMKSAANAYLVWYHGESLHAETYMRTWLMEQIKNCNSLIDAHNTAVETRRNRAKQYAKNTMNENPSATEKENLIADGKLTAAQWAALKQVKFEARDGSSNFTRIVKFVFGFKKPSDASHVSRYAKVLEYIEQHKNELGCDISVGTIVALLTDAGGFDAAIDKVRNSEAANDDNVREAKLTKIKEAVALADTGQLAFKAKFEKDGYVFLVGRPNGDQVTVCGELALNDNEADDMLLKIDSTVIGKPSPMVDFVARAFSLGELVREGRDSNINDTAGTGKKFKVARSFCLVGQAGRTDLSISARYTEASAVIHAYPKTGVTIGSVQQGQALMLKADAGLELGKQLRDPTKRVFLDLQAMEDIGSAPVVWEATTKLGDNAKTLIFEWQSLFTEANRPVSVKDSYDPASTITLKQEHLRAIFSEYLCQWKRTKKDDSKVKKQLTLSFDGSTFTVGHEAFGHKNFVVDDKLNGSVSLQMRPRDIVDLFTKLIELDVDCCSMSADPTGLLAVTWDDEVGDYAVYLPAIHELDGLKDKCMKYIKVSK